MLTTLLQNLQTLVSRSFVVAYFLPCLAFAVLNAAMLYWANEWFRGEARGVLSGTPIWRSSFLMASAFIAIALLAYSLSAVSGRLRAVLEGKWWDWLAAFAVPAQAERLDRLERTVSTIITTRDLLETRAPAWKERLVAARGFGPRPAGNTFTFADEPAARAIRRLRELRGTGKLFLPTAVENAVRELVTVLQHNNAEVADADGRYPLNEAHEQLVLLIDHGVEHARQEHIRMLNKKQFNFGAQQLSPTTMGNIANTIQSYAVSRYDVNLDLFWSRLQKAIQRDDKSYAVIQDSKTQLDFLVASCWLTVFWSLIWACALLVTGYDWRVFLGAAIGGPVMARMWYLVAIEQYRAFADTLRTSVDLFRFDLLKDLHLAAPADLHDERNLWDALNKLAGYGEDPNFRYQHPKSS